MADAMALVEQQRPAVEAEMRALLEGRPLPLYRMLRYHLGWIDEDGAPAALRSGAKRLRPALCLLACAAAGGDPLRAVPAAAALELLHNFTLIHDDIEDDGPTRHGRPTVWRLWGRPHAINAGDALHVVSTLALLRLSGAGHPAETVVQAARIINETCLRLCEGQYLDMEFEERFDVTEDDYRTMIGGKSAALISASLELGALLGGAPPSVAAALRGGGFDLGLAFQIQDDVLGVWGDEDLMGKAAGDIAQRKKSLPVVIGFREAAPSDRATLERVFGSDQVGPADVSAVLAVLDRVGARAHCEALAEDHHRRCVAQIEGSGLSAAALADLRTVIDGLLGRVR